MVSPILALVTALLAIFEVAIALSEITGEVAEDPVPPKSPANCIFPFSVVDASGIVTLVICVSTYVFTAFCVGNKTSLLPNAVLTDLLSVFS